MKEIVLYNPDTKKHFKAKFLNINGHRFNALSELYSEFTNTNKISNLVYTIASSGKEALDEMLKNEDLKPLKNIIAGVAKGAITYAQLSELFDSNNGMVQKANLAKRIEILQVMIDKDSLNDKEKGLLNSEEFWIEQDYLNIKEITDFFRTLL